MKSALWALLVAGGLLGVADADHLWEEGKILVAAHHLTGAEDMVGLTHE